MRLREQVDLIVEDLESEQAEVIQRYLDQTDGEIQDLERTIDDLEEQAQYDEQEINRLECEIDSLQENPKIKESLQEIVNDYYIYTTKFYDTVPKIIDRLEHIIKYEVNNVIV